MASIAKRAPHIVLALVLIVTGLAAPLVTSLPAAAAGLPVPTTATPLPTVQIDGIAWQQLVWGNTVYVGGSFDTARPAGAAPGSNTVTRSNLLAFDLLTGNLKTAFVANTNAQVLGLAMAPDGSRLYASGEFTSVNGSTANRIVALDPATGAVDTSFNAGTSYRVRSMLVTNDTVYVAGKFNSANGQLRENLAAFRRSDGAVLNWAPQATGGQVMALAMVPGSDRIAVGGAFNALSGVEAIGSGAVNPVTGSTMSFPLNQVVRNSGDNAAVYSMHFDDSKIYGTGYTYGPGGNFEGTFATDPKGNIVWLNDAWGDHYDSFASRGMLFSVGHLHNDANLEGGIPEINPRKHWHSSVSTSSATGVLQPSNFKTGSQANFAGQPAPTLLHWWPQWTTGLITSAHQAGWTIGGNEDYIVVAGEFRAVDGLQQQGIVRFTYRDIAASKDQPRLSGSEFVPEVTSPEARTVQVSFETNWDRDDAVLTYDIQREGAGTVKTLSAASHHNIRPVLTYLDTGLPAGSSQRYRLRATDGAGLTVTGDWVTVTVKSSGSLGNYAKAVLEDSPTTYRKLDESSGTVIDSGFTYNGSASSGVQRGVPGVDGTAYRFSGGGEVAWTSASRTTPRAFSTEAWIRTTTSRGGVITSWGNTSNGTSSKVNYVTYMGNDGKVRFGVQDFSRHVLTSPKSYNDGEWHHIVATLDWASGQRLYVDGQLVASDPGVKHGRDFQGYPRIADDYLGGWPSRPASDSLDADIDEVATYERAVPASRVLAHYQAATGGGTGNVSPVAVFSAVPSGLSVSVDGSASEDPDGRVVSYAWAFGDGATGSGATASHTYAAAGTYTVVLTVTDDGGATGSASRAVTVAEPPPGNVSPVAVFSAVPSGLSVSVDGSASEDPDGRVVSYAWAFGDGATGSGATASHTYAAAGTYTVVLTVTDDGGATGSASRAVTVAVAPPPPPGGALLADGFSRTVPAGWGSPDSGPAWSVTGDAAGYRVNGAEGELLLDQPGAKRRATAAVGAGDVDVTAVLAMDADPTGGGVFLNVGARSNGGDAYLARVKLRAGGAVVLNASRYVNGGYTALAGGTVPGLSYGAGDRLQVRLQVTGSGTTTVRAKVWRVGAAEPSDWFAVATDATAALQGSGDLYLEAYLSGSATTATTVTADNISATGPGAEPPPGNVSPVAVFSAVPSGLSVSVDGSASEDPDGRVVSYAWAFGDGATGSGATASHTYAAAGTYTVVLTVTDDGGATGSASRAVTVAVAPPPPPGGALLADGFSRTVPAGWGSPDSGPAWSVTGDAAGYRVNGAEGELLLDQPGAKRRATAAVGAGDVDVTAVLAMDADPTGGGVFLNVGARSNGGDAYLARVKLRAGGAVVLNASRYVNGGYTALAGGTVPGLSYGAGDRLQVRLQVTGSGTTTVRAKVWRVGAAEPSDWFAVATDATAALQGSGDLYLEAYLSGSATTATTVTADNISATPLL